MLHSTDFVERCLLGALITPQIGVTLEQGVEP